SSVPGLWSYAVIANECRPFVPIRYRSAGGAGRAAAGSDHSSPNHGADRRRIRRRTALSSPADRLILRAGFAAWDAWDLRRDVLHRVAANTGDRYPDGARSTRRGCREDGRSASAAINGNWPDIRLGWG